MNTEFNGISNERRTNDRAEDRTILLVLFTLFIMCVLFAAGVWLLLNPATAEAERVNAKPISYAPRTVLTYDEAKANIRTHLWAGNEGQAPAGDIAFGQAMEEGPTMVLAWVVYCDWKPIGSTGRVSAAVSLNRSGDVLKVERF